MGLNLGSLLKGVASKALGPLGAVAGDYAIGQLFGGKAKPSNALRNATSSAANPYQSQMADDANALRTSGQNLGVLVTPELMKSIQSQVATLSSPTGVDAVGNQIRQTGIQNANAAYRGGSANMARNLAQRGIGGGLAASAMLKLNSANSANRAGVENAAANAMIAKRQQNQAQLTSLLSGLQNQGQNDLMRGSQMLGQVGQNQANLQNQNAQNLQSATGGLLSLWQQAQGSKRKPTSVPVAANPWADQSYAPGASPWG